MIFLLYSNYLFVYIVVIPLIHSLALNPLEMFRINKKRPHYAD